MLRGRRDGLGWVDDQEAVGERDRGSRARVQKRRADAVRGQEIVFPVDYDIKRANSLYEDGSIARTRVCHGYCDQLREAR